MQTRSPAGEAGGAAGNGSGKGACFTCGGSDHKKQECPNLKAAKDDKWKAKPGEAKGKPCNKCGGTGHWAHHHAKQESPQGGGQRTDAQRGGQQESKQDCRYWMKGQCKKEKCQYKPVQHYHADGVTWRPMDESSRSGQQDIFWAPADKSET